MQKYVNENIVYYIWNTPKEKVDQAHVEAKKKDLNTELERWNNYLVEVNLALLNHWDILPFFHRPNLIL